MKLFRTMLFVGSAGWLLCCTPDLNDNECNTDADCRYKTGTVCSPDNWCVLPTPTPSTPTTPMDANPTLSTDSGVTDGTVTPTDAAPTTVDATAPNPDAALIEDEWTRLLGPCAHAPQYTPDPQGPPRADPYMDAFRELDFDQLPTRWRTEALTPIERSVLVYALGIRPETFRDKLVLADLLAQKPMGVVVAAAFASPGNRLNYDLLLTGMARFYNCDRALPPTLEAFRETIFDYQMMSEIDSAAKCSPRRLYEDHEVYAYVAETVIDGEVRETEIILGPDGTGAPLTFAVYDEEGRLSDRSTFPTVGGSQRTLGSPQVCLACHVNFERDPNLFDYDDLIPQGTGVCAQ